MSSEQTETPAGAPDAVAALASLWGRAGEVVIVLDPDGAQRVVSTNAEELFGHSHNELLGFASRELIHPDDLHISRAAADAALAGEASTCVVRFATKSGEWREVECRFSDERHNPLVNGMALYVRDVTESEVKARQLRALLDSLSDGVIVIDERRRIAAVNDAFLAMFNLDSDIEGRPADEVRSEVRSLFADQTAFEEGVKVALASSSPAQDELETVDGRMIQRTHNPLVNASSGRVWVYRDVSAEHRVLAAERLARSLAQEQERAALEMARLQRDFLAMVAHELRTPLNAVCGFTELLMLQEMEDEAQEFAMIVHRNAQKVANLAADLVLLGQLESGTAELSETVFSTHQFVEELVVDMMPLADEHGITLVHTGSFSGDCMIADKMRLSQVVSNLMHNAVKFSSPGSLVEVGFELGADEVWVLTVADHGAGIPEEALSKLFERFYRAENTRAKHGSGLGLSVVRSLVELHGGAITVESEVGAGTKIAVSFPNRLVRAS